VTDWDYLDNAAGLSGWAFGYLGVVCEDWHASDRALSEFGRLLAPHRVVMVVQS
jgi:hypothetical protein